MTPRDTTSLVDIHSHLVPGVDDGARDLDGAVAAVERMARAGIRRIVTTPHIRASLAQEPARLEERLTEVDGAYRAASDALRDRLPELDYLRGHEVMIDVPEPDLSDARIRMNGTAFVLVEWPRMHVPPGTPRVLRWMRDQKWIPVIAHPERYQGLSDHPHILRRWKDAGAFLQVNYGSFVGRYGSSAQETAFDLLEHGLADYLSSDFHGQSAMKIYKDEAWETLRAREGAGLLDLLCRANPARLIEGLEPLPVPALPPPRLIDRLRGMMSRSDRSRERTS